ncbi:MAG TPA: hypothetical protein VF247_02300 [Candidatus Krumholzibacteria bacterium]
MSVRWLGLVCAVLCLATAASAETVRLKDESTVRGRLVEVRGDTLVFRSTFGTLRFHRDQVVSIVFDDTAAAALVPPATAATPPQTPAGKSRIEVVFKDRDLSSKIEIKLKKDWDALIAANHIVTELYVDGAVAYSVVDTTMDKRIYQGHTTIMKNDVDLTDFGVDVPTGLHNARLVVRNAGGIERRESFDHEPLDKVLSIDNIELRPGETYRIYVEISRGRLKVVD